MCRRVLSELSQQVLDFLRCFALLYLAITISFHLSGDAFPFLFFAHHVVKHPYFILDSLCPLVLSLLLHECHSLLGICLLGAVVSLPCQIVLVFEMAHKEVWVYLCVNIFQLIVNFDSKLLRLVLCIDHAFISFQTLQSPPRTCAAV